MDRYCVGPAMATDWGEEDARSSLDRALVARVLRYIRPYWRAGAVALACILASALLGLAPALVFRALIDYLGGAHQSFGHVALLVGAGVTDGVPERLCRHSAHPGLLRPHVDAAESRQRSAIRKKQGRRARGSVRAMMKLSHVNVFVEDQDRAKLFYTEKLGFEVRSDATAERPYGIEAVFRDDSGNWFSLNQHKRYGGRAAQGMR